MRERRSRRSYRPRSGKIRADRPLRRAANWVHVIRQRRPPPHGQGGVRGRRGARPSHPLPLAGRRPYPDAGQQPQASGKKKKAPVRRHPPHQGIRSIQGECSPPIMRELSCRDDAHRRSTRRPGDIPPAQRAGARRRSPQCGSAAAGTHITREAGRCAPTCPCGERRTGYT